MRNLPPSFLGAGKQIAYGGTVVDLETGQRRALPDLEGPVRLFDGRGAASASRLARLSDGRVRDLPHGPELFAFRGSTAFGVCPAGNKEPVRVVTLEDGALRRLLTVHGSSARNAVFDPRLRHVVYLHSATAPLWLFWNAGGMHLWTGTRWRHLPWPEATPK